MRAQEDEGGNLGEAAEAPTERAPASDQALVARVLAGDRSAFAELYRRHAPTVGRRLERILGRPEDAKDVLQMTFIEAYRALGRYDQKRPFGAWLHGFAFRLTGRYLRGRKRQWWLTFPWGEEAREPADVGAVSSEAQASARQLASELYAALDRLDDKKRIAFALAELEDLPLAEIGELVGASVQTVWARVQAARKELIARLGVEPDARTAGKERKP